MSATCFDDLLARLDDLAADELETWIEAGLVRPIRREGVYWFTEIDCARVELIHELGAKLDVDEETLPVLLSLLDQVYSLRRSLRHLTHAVQAQPRAVRTAILDSVKRFESAGRP